MSKSGWTADDMTDQTGRVAIVTGANSGIGFHAARHLAARGAEVVLACRTESKALKARDEIRAQHTGADVEFMQLDLSDLASVKAFADEFLDRYDRLDLLVNNAGVMVPPYSKTKDGFELQFGTNHLGHFALDAHLIELVMATEGSRVVTVSSGAHKAGKIDFDDPNWEKRSYSAWRAYGQSKIANLYFALELDRRLRAAGSDTISTAAHPGWAATELQSNSAFAKFLNPIFAQTPEQGSWPTLAAATAPSDGGDYWGPNGFAEMKGQAVEVEPNDLAKDPTIAERLWRLSEELTGVEFEIPAATEGRSVA